MTQVRFQAMRPIATSNVLVCGTGRNVSRKIDDFLKGSDEPSLRFQSLQHLICESFSTDRTVEKLEEINQTKKIMNWFTDSEIDIKKGLRTARRASARNQLIQKSRKYQNNHYVAMAEVKEKKEGCAGDPAFLCADMSLIKGEIGVSAKYSLKVSAKSLF